LDLPPRDSVSSLVLVELDNPARPLLLVLLRRDLRSSPLGLHDDTEALNMAPVLLLELDKRLSPSSSEWRGPRPVLLERWFRVSLLSSVFDLQRRRSPPVDRRRLPLSRPDDPNEGEGPRESFDVVIEDMIESERK